MIIIIHRLLKIKKNTVVGCKTTLNKNNSLLFLENIILFVLPNTTEVKKYKFNNQSQVLSFNILNILDFLELKNEFLTFNNLDLPPLNVSIHLKSKNNLESTVLLSSLNFPINV